MAITDVAHLLEFLDAKEIAQLLHARKDAEQDGAAVWHWIVTRTRQHMPEVELPRLPPSRERRLDPALLDMLLRRLHVVMTCTKVTANALSVGLLLSCTADAVHCHRPL